MFLRRKVMFRCLITRHFILDVVVVDLVPIAEIVYLEKQKCVELFSFENANIADAKMWQFSNLHAQKR